MAHLFDGFDEVRYLEANKDVSEAVKKGSMASGLDHYIFFWGEGESPWRHTSIAPSSQRLHVVGVFRTGAAGPFTKKSSWRDECQRLRSNGPPGSAQYLLFHSLGTRIG